MNKQKLNVTIIQTNLNWENKVVNLLHIEELINSIESETDLIILPEMFSTGFSMNSKLLAEDESGVTVNWMKQISKKNNCLLIGSIIAEQEHKYFNRLYCVFPNGNFLTYDKRHLFSYGNEHLHYYSGNEQLIVDWLGWKICPLICYDLRFPVWSRNTMNYDLLIYVANWPNRRAFAWNTLLKARAIENQSYTIGVNRVGVDGIGLEYSGDSQILDFVGNTLFEISNVECQKTISLDKESQIAFRSQFGFLNDQDKFNINYQQLE